MVARNFFKLYAEVPADLFSPQYCIGCSRRASDVPCRACFDSLLFVGRPLCGRCRTPRAFEGPWVRRGPPQGLLLRARALLRYEGAGEELVHASSTGYLCVAEKAMAPLLRGVLGGSRFDTVVPVPLRRVRLAERDFTLPGLMTRGVVGRIEALVLDKLKAMRRIRPQVEHPERVCQVFNKAGAVEVRFLPPCRTVKGCRMASQRYEQAGIALIGLFRGAAGIKSRRIAGAQQR